MSADPTTENGAATPNKKDGNKDASKLNEREQTLLCVAMAHCLKSGPPEIDYEKFMQHGNFNTMKTAQNTWGKIKAKLNAATTSNGSDEGGEAKTPKTPKAQAATTPGSKKRTKKADSVVAGPDDNDEDGSPKKKRKAMPKKKGIKKEEDSEDDAPVADEE